MYIGIIMNLYTNNKLLDKNIYKYIIYLNQSFVKKMGGIKIPKKSVHPRKTYILNLDGMRADYFITQGHQGCLTTTLKYLAEHGVRFSKCKDILPAVTATNQNDQGLCQR